MFIVIFIAGLSLKIIGIAVLILIPFFGGFFWYIQQDNLPQFLNGYQRQRILGHMYGGGSTQDQQNNSIMAIGSGQLTGKGINSSDVATVKDTNLISEQQTDFIFSAVGEELGFIGSVIIIAILLLIVLQCIRVARRSGDKKGMYIATGMAALVSIQSFINIGVATSILPNTGLPLPFISYGLSSLVSLCAGMGMVLNINLQKKSIRRIFMNIGLIAHDAKKKLMQNFCIAYRGILNKHELYATGTTGRLIEEVTNLTVHKYIAGHLGGEQQLGSQIENNDIDMVIFLRDPLHPKNHEPDINNIFTLCDTHNIPLATNLATAELLILALDRGDLDWREFYK